MEKGKNKLEGENGALQLDLRDLRAAFAEGDKRRKTAEAQLSESQAKNTEDTGKIQDIASQNDKLKVWGTGEWGNGVGCTVMGGVLLSNLCVWGLNGEIVGCEKEWCALIRPVKVACTKNNYVQYGGSVEHSFEDAGFVFTGLCITVYAYNCL